MTDVNKKLDEVFEAVESVLDEVHTRAYGLLDEMFSHVDKFVGAVQEKAREQANARVPGEKAKVAPDVATMREDIKRSRARMNGQVYVRGTNDIWDRVTEGAVKNYWAALPADDKSWVEKDKNSPL